MEEFCKLRVECECGEDCKKGLAETVPTSNTGSGDPKIMIYYERKYDQFQYVHYGEYVIGYARCCPCASDTGDSLYHEGLHAYCMNMKKSKDDPACDEIRGREAWDTMNWDAWADSIEDCMDEPLGAGGVCDNAENAVREFDINKGIPPPV